MFCFKKKLGRSLDKVMELKEQAGNRNLLKVEKKLKRKRRKKEKAIRDGYAYEKVPSVFDFINTKLATEMPTGKFQNNSAVGVLHLSNNFII